MAKKIRVTIEADVNDGDYIYKIIDVTQKELNTINPVIMKLKEINQSDDSRHNFEKLIKIRDNGNDEKLSDLIQEFMDNYVPYLDNQDVHTIKSISYCDSPKEEWEFLDE